MKTLVTAKRAFAIIALLIVCFAMPKIVEAKMSKASSKFTYDGVSVEVVDRRAQIGRSHTNTYGYTNFINRNDKHVVVTWICYGVLNHTHKLVQLSMGTFGLNPNERRGEVYSYRAGKYQINDFEKYVVAIEVTKDEPTVEPEVVAEPQKIDDSVYNRVMQNEKNGTATQTDYSDGIDWLNNLYETRLKQMTIDMWAMQKKNDEKGVDRIIKENQTFMDMWSEMADMLDKAYSSGKLDSSNSKKFLNIKNKVIDFMQNY